MRNSYSIHEMLFFAFAILGANAMPSLAQGTATYHSTLASMQALTSTQMASQQRICIDGVNANSNEGAGCFVWYGPAAASAVTTGSMAGGAVTVTSISSGQVSVGSRISGTGVTPGSVIFEQPTANGSTGGYSEPIGTTVGSETLTFALIPNGGTIIAPSGQTDCLSGCLVKADWRAPTLEDFGLSQFNTAAANTSAMTQAIAATTFIGAPGQYEVGTGSFHFNGPIQWPSGVYPVGRGSQATRFLIDNCADGFDFQGGGSFGITNVVGSHPAKFEMSPSCATTEYNGGIGVNAETFDQQDSISDINIQSVLGAGHGGIGFECSGCAHTHAYEITSTGINGYGNVINVNGSDTCNGFTGDNLNGFSNADVGLKVDCGTSGAVQITGSEEGNNGSANQATIASGFQMDIRLHLEGCPTVVSGKWCATIGNSSGNPLSRSNIHLDFEIPYATGLNMVNLISGQGITVDATSGNGAGEDAASVFYNIGALCYYCEARMPSPGIPVVNGNSTSRKTYDAAYSTGVRATANGSSQAITTSVENAIAFQTILSDPLSEFHAVAGYCSISCFTPDDYGSYSINFTMQVDHNDTMRVSNQINMEFYDSTTATTIAIPCVLHGVQTNTVLSCQYTTDTIGPTDHIQPRMIYIPGGAATVTLSGYPSASQLQIFRVK